VTALRSLSRAMALGFVRDRATVFFTVLFPLMFLVLLGSLFRNAGSEPSTVLQAGPVPVLDRMPAPARAELDQAVTIQRVDSRDAALSEVRAGDADAAVTQSGDQVVVHYSAADPVRSGTVRGVLTAIVQEANLRSAGVADPRYVLTADPVEDASLQPIQFLTPGLLGWAVASGATFGAALTLVSWRQKKLLRRIRLAPVPVPAVVGARVGVSIAVAIAQTALFIGVAIIPFFGLQLTGSWWLAIPLVIVGTLSFLAIGLLAGAVSKTPEAATAVANLIVLPMAFLSGAFFPLEDAPSWLRAVSNVLPLKHLVESMQDVMVRGEGPASTVPTMAILLGFTVVVSAVAVRLFRWDDV
jgi:ABC-2 type transport system permease protein